MIPTDIDPATFALTVRGHVNQTLSLSLNDILHGLPSVQLAAVNQCSGNSRGFFEPRVPGGEWANGAMGNALWTGVRLKDVLDKAGVKPGAVQVRFKGLDEPVVSDAPHFMKSLDIEHARDGEVMIAYAINGEQLPLVNGFPLRLVVPGWYATYWVKMLSDIEVLDQPDDNYWTKVAYTIPDTPHASITPGETGVKMVPINRMVPRSFVTNIPSGQKVKAAAQTGCAALRSAAIAAWRRSTIPSTMAKAGIRRSSAKTRANTVSGNGAPRSRCRRQAPYAVMIRCTNANGAAQPDSAELESRRLHAQRRGIGGYRRRLTEGHHVQQSAAGRHCDLRAVDAADGAARHHIELKPVKIDLPDSDRAETGWRTGRGRWTGRSYRGAAGACAGGISRHAGGVE